MSIIDWSVYIVYFIGLAVMIAITKRAKTMEDYAVGSRQIPGGIIFASLSATFIGPGYTMGLANNAAEKGYIWFIIFCAFSLQTILVGLFVAPRLRQYDKAYTLGNIMGYHYGKAVQFISGVITVILCTGVVGTITKASGDIISGFTGLPFIWAVVISASVVLLYSTVGGIKTVVMTDVLQFILLSICVPLILIMMFAKHGITEMIHTIPVTAKTLSGHFSPLALFSLFLAFFFGECLLPPYTNRALMANDKKSAKIGFLLTGGFSVSWFFICTSIGIFSMGVLPEGTENYYIGAIQTFLPAGLLGLVIASMISIIMSSQDSFLNAASVSFSGDVLTLFSPKFKEGKQALLYSRILNVIIGFFAVIFATKIPSIVEALLLCYTLWAPTIVFPLLIAVIKKDVHPIAGFGAIICGGMATGLWEWGLNSPYEIPSLIVGIIFNQFAYWSLHIIFRNRKLTGLFEPIHH